MQRLFQPLGIVFVGLVGRQHIVISGDDGDITAHHVFQCGFVVRLTGGKTVRQVAAGQLCAVHGLGTRRFNACQIGGAALFGTVDDALRDTG
ncbi:hypothetical protein D3C72_1237210 [compost metagenome]